MPVMIEHIDAIARKKQRGVLFVSFSKYIDTELDWRNEPARKDFIDFLEQRNIAWTRCGEFADVNMMCVYCGQIYIDVAMDDQCPIYCELRDYLENGDGSMKNPRVLFWYLPLERAMENAAHDEPGFWEDWAEHF